MRPERTTYVRAPVLVMLGALAATLGGCAAAPVMPRRCPLGLQGSFVQINDQQLDYGEPEWAGQIDLLRAAGVETLIVQFSGDVAGAYDDRDRARTRPAGPVRALLAAAGTAGLKVYLGLHADDRWPNDPAAASGLPAPLQDPVLSESLGQLCRMSPACVGWYLSSEIDDLTWQGPERTAALRAYLGRTSAALRRLTPGRPLVVAPFFTGRLDPQAHARWWGELMVDRPFEVLALQDGVGTKRASPERAAEYLRALRPVAAQAGVRLWSVLELFEQLTGTPHDDRPFTARSASFSTIRRSLELERPLVEQAIGFAVLDYLNPRGSRRASRLYNQYVYWCEQAPRSAPPSANEKQGAVSTADLKAKKKGT